MKKLIILLAFSLGVSIASAQHKKESEIPEVVKTAFARLFPRASPVKWEKEKDGYEAEFTNNKTEQSASFDKLGNLTESEIEIKISELPQTIITYVADKYKVAIKEAAKITDATGKVTYEAEVKGKDLIFDEQGIFLKEE
jgi:hypothetical protein